MSDIVERLTARANSAEENVGFLGEKFDETWSDEDRAEALANIALDREAAAEIERLYEDDRGRTREHNILVQENRALAARLDRIREAAEPIMERVRRAPAEYDGGWLYSLTLADLRSLALALGDEPK